MDNVNEDNKSKKVTVRFSPAEHKRVEDKRGETTCRTLSEYIRDVMLNRKLTFKLRDVSLDVFMEEMILARKELNALANNFNQVVRKINACQSGSELVQWLPECARRQQDLLSLVEQFQDRMNQLSTKWLQE